MVNNFEETSYYGLVSSELLDAIDPIDIPQFDTKEEEDTYIEIRVEDCWGV